MMISKTQNAMPNDWSKVLKSVRYVGVRLADACASALQEHNRMTPEELLSELDHGMFRFRTSSPLREIHAALLKTPNIKKNGRTYVWTAPPERQLPMRLRVEKESAAPVSDLTSTKARSARSESGAREKEETAKVM